MDEGKGILPGLPAVAGKPVHVTFDGGRLTSGGILLLSAIERSADRRGEAIAAMVGAVIGIAPPTLTPEKITPCRQGN